VKSLEENGVINGYYADINESAVNLNVTVFAYLKLESQNEEDLKNFEAVVQNFDMVRECYMMSGDVDFVLKCVAPHWQDFQKFLSEKLTTLPNVKSIKTAIVCRISKKLSSAYFVE
jgi:DNA-binding Lrp family transcriptional regulator